MNWPIQRQRLIPLVSTIGLFLVALVLSLQLIATHSNSSLSWSFLIAMVALSVSVFIYFVNLEKEKNKAGGHSARQLERVSAELHAFMEGSTEHSVFSIDRQFRYLHFNTRHKKDLQQYFDASPQIGELIPPIIPPDIVEELRKNFLEAFSRDHYTTTRKLRERYFKIIFTPIIDAGGKVLGLTCSFNDITEKVTIEQQLEEYRENLESKVEERTKELSAQRDFFQKVIDATSNLIFVRDQEGNYVLVNQAAADSFPDHTANVIGKSIMTTHRNENQARTFMLEDKEILRTGKQFISESTYEDKEGIKKSLYLTKSLLEVNKRKYVLGVHTDVTELKRQEGALKKSNQELSQALKKLQDAQAKLIESEKLASLGQLTAGLAHEINNPINYVSGNVSPLMRDFQDLEEILVLVLQLRDELQHTDKGAQLLSLMDELEIEVVIQEIKKLLEGIENGTNRVRDLMSSLKNLSRQDDKAPVKMAINKIIRSTMALIKPSVPHGIELKDDLTRVPMTYGNPGEISQVLLNIIDNALFAMKGHGTLKVSSKVEHDMMVITIADTGSGISKEIIRRIFEPFFTTKEVGEGTGLGLAISHQIINKHGGHLQVNSELGVGTTFTISLPIKKELPT
ncbi:MAG: ATP-binding protein [Bacteroidota bacterium]